MQVIPKYQPTSVVGNTISVFGCNHRTRQNIPSGKWPILACCYLLLCFCVQTGDTENADTVKKPNIFFMMVDDWGWANVGYHRDTPTKDISAPNIDALVQQELQLDQHYVYNWCSPSRSALLTGRVPIHVNDVIP